MEAKKRKSRTFIICLVAIALTIIISVVDCARNKQSRIIEIRGHPGSILTK